MMDERNMTIREELIRLEVQLEAIEKDLSCCLGYRPGESIESLRHLIVFPITSLGRARSRCEIIKGKIPL